MSYRKISIKCWSGGKIDRRATLTHNTSNNTLNNFTLPSNEDAQKVKILLGKSKSYRKDMEGTERSNEIIKALSLNLSNLYNLL